MKKVYVDTLYAVNIIQNLEICISKLEKFITNAVNSESEKVMCDFEYKGMGKQTNVTLDGEVVIITLTMSRGDVSCEHLLVTISNPQKWYGSILEFKILVDVDLNKLIHDVRLGKKLASIVDGYQYVPYLY